MNFYAVHLLFERSYLLKLTFHWSVQSKNCGVYAGRRSDVGLHVNYRTPVDRSLVENQL